MQRLRTAAAGTNRRDRLAGSSQSNQPDATPRSPSDLEPDPEDREPIPSPPHQDESQQNDVLDVAEPSVVDEETLAVDTYTTEYVEDDDDEEDYDFGDAENDERMIFENISILNESDVVPMRRRISELLLVIQHAEERVEFLEINRLIHVGAFVVHFLFLFNLCNVFFNV